MSKTRIIQQERERENSIFSSIKKLLNINSDCGSEDIHVNISDGCIKISQGIKEPIEIRSLSTLKQLKNELEVCEEKIELRVYGGYYA